MLINLVPGFILSTVAELDICIIKAVVKSNGKKNLKAAECEVTISCEEKRPEQGIKMSG